MGRVRIGSALSRLNADVKEKKEERDDKQLS